jgi:hypothetical protein
MHQACSLSLQRESPSPNSAKTPPSVPSGSPSPLMSLSEVSSRCPHSPVLEQGDPPGRLQWWIFLRLLMREISSLMSHGMRSSTEDFLTTSTVTFLGRPATTRSSFSATSTNKRMCVRRRPPTPKLRHLLL